jgi:hypothetical protein
MLTTHLTTKEVILMAQQKITDPDAHLLKIRLFIGYASGLRSKYALDCNGHQIQDNCMVFMDYKISHQRCIPLHPLVLRIFKSYNDYIPTIKRTESFVYRKKLAEEMNLQTRIELRTQLGKKIKKKVLLDPFRLNSSKHLHMEEYGMSPDDIRLLTGHATKIPEALKGREEELKKLFANPFFDHLKYLIS